MRQRTMLLLLLVLASFSCNKTIREDHLLPGQAAPSFKLKLLNGTSITREDTCTRPSVIVFFNVLEPESREVLEEMQRLHTHWGNKIDIVAIETRGKQQTTESYWKYSRFTMPVAVDEGCTVTGLFDRTEHPTVPQVYCLSSQGRVIRYYGPHEGNRCRQIEEQLIIPYILKQLECETN